MLLFTLPVTLISLESPKWRPHRQSWSVSSGATVQMRYRRRARQAGYGRASRQQLLSDDSVGSNATTTDQRTQDRSIHSIWLGWEQEDGWFSLRKRVLPRDTDYAGIVWHGRYVDWFEEARVAFLAFRGLAYETLVKEHQCETPVVHMSLNYRRPVRFGDDVLVQVRVQPRRRPSVRIPFLCRVISTEHSSDTADVADEDATVHVDALVELTTVERDTGRVLRKLPRQLEEALCLARPSSPDAEP
ncbi:hypothetical protein CCYA_CCYA13G3564 [Cyanidiococcus yangmingshanensis]|nr:hypothetical protein CCYA_CCYA13G3564 [Cyanidiococcus yangmingshanensis]